ncbi:ABC transporter substrate-binding protein [Lacisediminimonas sp.]|uniref:ABC transporter substrate-binding protein n=1 Tax=Lacisediminimonas sp. TaxID=3060582 RepID=UPI0027207E9A|nr:ABC transporter substrate-binding protein [Lacisediminimonas sp.]MDO8298733.1 ABC transporter substrate-binding protein [Lacisediminimonas sp.]MDO9215694.1 ABC transporter substrate-binding protein [Lacisediminimonas sp.]
MGFQKVLAVAMSALLISAGAAQTATAQSAAKKDLIKINIGGPSAGYWNTYLANDLGIYQKHGLDPSFHWFTSGAPLLAALKSGSIDQVVTGLAIVFAIGQNIPLKVVSWELDNAQGEGLMVTSKSGIRDYKDIIKAKAIAAANGTCSQVSLRLIAKAAGVDYAKLNVINLAPPLFANAFTGGSIDAAVGWAPWTMVQPAGVKVVSWDADYGSVCPSLNAFRPAYLEKNPDAAIRLLQVQAETMEMVRKNPKLAIDALQKYMKLSEPVAKQFYERHCCDKLPTFEQQLDPNSRFSLTSKEGGLAQQLHTASQMLHEGGTIPAPLSFADIHKAIDSSYLRKYVDAKSATK